MSTTKFTAAALVLAALATPTALAYEVFDVLWVSEEGVGTQDAGTYHTGTAIYFYTGEDEPADEPSREDASATDAPPSSATVDALGIATVTVPLPIETTVAVVAPLLGPLAVPVVNDLVVDAVPASAPAPSSPRVAPAAAAEPEFVPLIVPPEPSVPAAVVAAGAATVAAAGAASTTAPTVWERLRRIGLGIGAVLYSRIAKERLLDHGSRERLLETIRARPGLAVQDLSEVTAIPRNTVTYHLRVLERESLVSSQRQGRNRLFFAPGSLPQKQNADALATLRHETTLKMAQAIGAMPGLDQKALCAQVGVSPSLAHWHADRLVASGVVDKRREGRFVRYYPGTAFTVVASRS